MVCPKCKGKVVIVDSVNTPEEEIYRRRKCIECGHNFYTVEFEVECNAKFEEEWAAYYRYTPQ